MTADADTQEDYQAVAVDNGKSNMDRRGGAVATQQGYTFPNNGQPVRVLKIAIMLFFVLLFEFNFNNNLIFLSEFWTKT